MPTVTTTEVGFGSKFWKSLYSLSPNETQQGIKTIERFCADPIHPSLNLHPIQADGSGRLHTIRVSQELRILLAKEGGLYVLLEAGHHDPIYERALRARFVVNPASRYVGMIEPSDDLPDVELRTAPASAAREDRPKVFDHWTNAELADAGLPDDAISQLRSCTTEDDLCDLEELDEELLDLAIDLMETTPEEWKAKSQSLFVDEQATEQKLRHAIENFGALSGISPLFTPEEVAELAAAPIEDWMIFLHPDQRAVAERNFEGPARVRGAAGTGKTVVALHRAVALAKRFEEEGASKPLLFTTFINSLPPVFEHLHARLPGARPDRVEFINIDKLAYRICAEGGERPQLAPPQVDAAFAKAWFAVVSAGSPIAKAGLTRQYLRDEIQAVIKGRGISDLDSYLALERTGRRTRFGEPLRRQAWELHLAWTEQMAARNCADFADVILRARDLARRRPAPTYRAAIIDEAQDLTLVGLQFVRALVNGSEGVDQQNGLFIVGDGAQRIYPGGFTLRQAGVEVRGRTSVLRTNYRNTAEILGTAMAIAGGEAVDDLGDTYARGEADAETHRNGSRPLLVRCAGEDDEAGFVAQRILDLVHERGVGVGDLAVLAPTNRAAKSWMDRLGSAGIAVLDLSKYQGEAVDAVKIGTYNRAKGLEFKVVFLPGLDDGRFPPPQHPGQDPHEYEDERSLNISRLFVAITRARDGLFLSCSGEPCDVLIGALDHFDVIDS